MKILLIDDDAFLRDMYAKKFGERGHQVEVAKTAEDGLYMLQSDDSFDVVISDVVMPGMTGIELLKKIKTEGANKELKCIMLSNQGEESEIEAAKKNGAIGYIIKAEMIPSEVVTKVESLVQ